MTYLPVGWGSHHWDVLGGDQTRWFVTVDELENKRASTDESLDQGFARLLASLRSAVALRAAGREFVVAPVPARDGEPAVRAGGPFAVAVYPFVEGRSDGWGEWTAASRAASLDMVARVHSAPREVRRLALDEDFGVPFRDLVEAACAGREPGERGPYTARAARLLREYAEPVRRCLSRYDELALAARARPGRNVLTHGEPHPGNVMATDGGWRLIDWDTALTAPPERDLWDIEPGDGSVLAAYADLTGITPAPELIELYRLGWEVRDMAYDTARFFRSHSGGAEDAQTWELLSALIRRSGELTT
jgi:spectinomycin phosphotransferase/16S rRNA (guanine(1405)-N(7))-methyltransferase